jgi:hypothetical protein
MVPCRATPELARQHPLQSAQNGTREGQPKIFE